MGRLKRSELGAGVYHVFNRGLNNGWILSAEEGRDRFCRILGEKKEKYRLNIYHYCIMSNHFHLAIEGPIKEISAYLGGVSSSYSKYWHAVNRSGYGPIWQGRFKSIIVQKDPYQNRLGRYIEQNPLRAKLADQAAAYPWSSAAAYTSGKPDPLVNPAQNPLWESWGETEEKRRQNYKEYLKLTNDEDLALFRNHASSIGDDAFRARLHTVTGRSKLRPGRQRAEK